MNPVGAALRAIGRTRQRLIDHGVALREDPRVTKAGSGVDVRESSAGPYGWSVWTVELWADAELHDDTGRTWWIEVIWDSEGWRVESSLLIDSVDGQEHGWEGETRNPRTVDELVAALAGVTDALLAQPIPSYKELAKKQKDFPGR